MPQKPPPGRSPGKGRAALAAIGLLAVVFPLGSGATVDHAAIVISSDRDFTAENGVVSGSGTASDPFVVSGWRLPGSGDGAEGLSVRNTTKHVVFRSIDVVGNQPTGWGVDVYNARHVTFEDVRLLGAGAWVGVGTSDDVRVLGLQANGSATLFSAQSSNVTFERVDLPGPEAKVQVFDSWDVTVSDVHIGAGDIVADGAAAQFRNVSVDSGRFYYAPLAFGASLVPVVENVTVDGYPVRLETGQPDLSIDGEGVGYLIMWDCPNARLANLTVPLHGSVQVHGSPGAAIRGMRALQPSFGLIVASSPSASVESSNFSWDHGEMVTVSDSAGVRIIGNEFAGNGSSLSISQSSHATLRGNHFSRGATALLSASDNLSIEENAMEGEGPSGLEVFDAEAPRVANNSITGRSAGIRMIQTPNATVTGNRISFSEVTAIGVYGYASNAPSESATVIAGNVVQAAQGNALTVEVDGAVEVVNNSATASEWDVQLRSFASVRMEGNRFDGWGVWLHPYSAGGTSSVMVAGGNTLNGLPLVQAHGCDATPFEGVSLGQLVVANCDRAFVRGLLDATPSPSIVSFNVSQLTLEDIRLEDVRGSSLLAWETDDLVLRNVSLTGSAEVLASNVNDYVRYSANLTVVNSSFSTRGNGTGVYLNRADRVDVVGSFFGSTVNGAGLVVEYAARVDVTDSRFEGGLRGVDIANTNNLSISHSSFQDLAQASVDVGAYGGLVDVSFSRFLRGGTALLISGRSTVAVHGNTFGGQLVVLHLRNGELSFWGNDETGTRGTILQVDEGWVAVFANNFRSPAPITVGPHVVSNWHWGPWTGGNYWEGLRGDDDCHAWTREDCGGPDGFFDDGRRVTTNRSDFFPRVDPYADNDGDGVDDQWELRYGLSPADPDDWAADVDGDSLDFRAEFENGTDPTNPDTNGNGLPDADDPSPWDFEPVSNRGVVLLVTAFMVVTIGLSMVVALFHQRFKRMKDW